jgi:hypothetical protein
VRQQASGTQIFNVDTAAGNVGVGTSMPLAKLQVGIDPTIPAGSDAATAIKGNLVVDGKIYGDGSLLTSVIGTDSTRVLKAGDTMTGALTLSPSSGDALITTAGNVGIGSTVPQAKLEVDGAVYIGQAAAPSPADNRLYNTGGNLFWGGSPLATGVTLIWNIVSGTSQSMSVNNGYIANNAGLVTVTLPATTAAGTVVAVAGGLNGTGGWKLAQNADQVIHFGSVNTTTGATGYLSSNNQFDAVQLLCVKADTDFVVIASQGNITYF